MPTTSTTATSTTATDTAATGTAVWSAVRRAGDRPVPMELAELVCADADLLAREFADLIAANYPPAAAAPALAGPPRRPRVGTEPARGPREGRALRPTPPECAARPAPRPAVVVDLVRQRSPPGGQRDRAAQADAAELRRG